MMVAVSIFSLVMMVAIGAVLSIVSANKKGQALSSVINNLNFALESMNRDLRTGSGYVCESGGSSDCTSIKFDSSQYHTEVTYSLQGNTIIKTKDGVSSSIISSEVYIEKMIFSIADEFPAYPKAGYTQTDLGQARIFLTIKGCAKASRQPTGCGATEKDISTFNLQTLLTQRKFDI